MKRIAIALLLLTAISKFAGAQTCDQSSFNNLGQFDITPDPAARGHINGNHIFNGGTAQICTYVSTGNQNCGVTAKADPYGGITDKGLLTTFPIGFHVPGVAYNPGSQYNPNGGATANGNTAAAVLWCQSSSCDVTVSANPVSFPGGSVWTHGPSFSVVCPAVPDPSQQCSGNPDFTCCNGSPTCSNGSYSCNGDGLCYFANIPTDCTAGQSPQCNCDGSWQCVDNPGTPIIIDTAGTGFQMTNAAQGVRFDLDPTKPAEQLSWTMARSRNGWLALPHDGKVETGRDLFGNFTPQPPSSNPNGFLALAVYDLPENGGNGDGIIDWHDAVFAKLRVWIDENHDGRAQPNELYTLPAVGVYSISLSYTESKFTDNWGNQFRLKGTINSTGNPSGDHIDRVIYDVYLQSGHKNRIDSLIPLSKDPLRERLQ